MTLPTITFDCDGVFANFTKKFVDLLHSDSGVEITPDWPNTQPIDSIMTLEQWKRGWELVSQTPFFWATLEAYPNSPFAKVERMMAEGVMVGYFVSHRPDTLVAGGDARLCTRIWLESQGIHSAQGIIVGTHFDRAELLKSLRCDAHLDDQVQNVEYLRSKGINAYLLERPWSRLHTIDPTFVVHDVYEFLMKAVATRIPTHAKDVFFSPAQQNDLVHPLGMFKQDIPSVLPGFRVSALAERASTPRPA